MLFRVHSSGTVSEVTLTPTIDLDFGTLECVGVNAIGFQRTPCYFELIPIGKSGTLGSEAAVVANQERSETFVKYLKQCCK